MFSGKGSYRKEAARGRGQAESGDQRCIDTEDDGWVEGEIVAINPLPFKRGEKRNRRKYVIKTSETHDTIQWHGYHVGGEVGAVQLHEMDWWAIKERQDGEDIDSDEDSNNEKEEGEGRQAAKKPKGTGQDTEQGQDKEVSKSGGGRVVKEKLSKSGGSRDKGKAIGGRHCATESVA